MRLFGGGPDVAISGGTSGAAGAGGLAWPAARVAAAAVALALAASALVVSGGLPGIDSGLWTRDGATDAEVAEAFSSLPIAFEPNVGQAGEGLEFVAHGPGYALGLSPTAAVLSFSDGDGLRMSLVGAASGARPEASDRLGGVVNYLKGSDPQGWHRNVPTYRTVAFEDVYPGIDMVYRGAGGLLQYDFVVHPGGDPADIVLSFEGARSLSLADDGALVVGTRRGDLRQSRPVLFQQSGGRRVPVEGSFERRGGSEVGFDVGRYDRSRTLVIDPTLSYATYVGASAFDITFGVDVDPAGRTYVAGHTTSVNFPTLGDVPCTQPSPTPTPPAAATTSFQCNQPVDDAFVAVLNPEGTALEWATYLGGRFVDQAWDVAIDRRGNAYVAGATGSFDDITTAGVDEGFPTTPNAFDRTCGTDGSCNALFGDDSLSDTFMAKLSNDGSELLYSSYLGGSDFDQETQTTALPSEMDIAVRGSKAYMVGATASADFPTTKGALDRHCGRKESVPVCDDGERDAFLAIFHTGRSGSDSLVLSSYLGGSGTDEGRGVGVDNAGNVYVALTTYGFEKNPDSDDSPIVNNVKTKNALYPDYRGGEADAFVMKIKPNRTGSKQRAWATYLGGGGRDQAWGLAVKSGTSKKTRGRGAAFVVGFTDSGNDPATPEKDGLRPYFPRTKGVFDRSYAGQHTAEDFSNQFLNGDAYLTKLHPSGRKLVYSGLIGGEFHDVAGDVDVDRKGNAYVTGYVTCDTRSAEEPPCNAVDFPIVEPLFGASMHGAFPPGATPALTNIPTDSFAVRVSRDGGRFLYSMFLPGDHFDRGFGVAVRDRDQSGDNIRPEAYYVGRTNSASFPPMQQSTGSFLTTHQGGGRDGYVIKIRS